MTTPVSWQGIENQSIETLSLTTSGVGTLAKSTIQGTIDSQLFTINYAITTNTAGETTRVQISTRFKDREEHLKLESNGNGSWILNGEPAPQLNGCIDVDLPVTPYTNTLPIKRLHLPVGEEAIIKVVYLDVLAGNTEPVAQKYRRISEFGYHYENIPNDFEADIEVDGLELVTFYPQLFTRCNAG